MAFSNAQDAAATSENPVIFGIEIGPPILGGVFAVLGLGVAVYAGITFGLPKWEEYQKLNAAVADKQRQLEQSAQEKERLKAIFAQLEKARSTQSQVLALFPQENTLAALPLDLNQIIMSQSGKLQQYVPDPKSGAMVEDGSWGTALNGQLREQKVRVGFIADFQQTTNILRSLERYQSMLAVDNVSSELKVSNQPLRFNAKTGQLLPEGAPKIKILTQFDLKVLTPLSPKELAAKVATGGDSSASPTASPSPGGEKK